MSHFAVLVVTDTLEELEPALQPYHEYECTGINDEYVKFVALDGGEQNGMREEAEETGITIEEAAEEEGCDIRDGVIGRYTNPDSKWDWWEIGGRWSGSLKHKDGTMVDQCKKSDVDFNGRIALAEEKAALLYDEAAKIINGRKWLSWDCTRNKSAAIDNARETYNNQQVIKDLKKTYNHPFFDCDQFGTERDKYIKNKGLKSIETFAVLMGGSWYQNGDMGWFGCVANKKEGKDWSGEFMSLINKVGDDQWLTVVDCHV